MEKIEPATTLLIHTAAIVAAHVGHNRVAVGDLGRLIAAVHCTLAGLGQTALAPPAGLMPAVPVGSSLGSGAIVCLECGKHLRMLRKHLQSAHGLSPADYRARWDLSVSYPLVCLQYARERSAIAKAHGFGRRPVEARPPRPRLSLKL